ncbi:MAG TPA: hypothetical protein VKV39_16160 [Candidatus Sulfotelmatobacter sp.]|nr:hypothetical protein [Candidatus Sulfotelmatobacter sp.]
MKVAGKSLLGVCAILGLVLMAGVPAVGQSAAPSCNITVPNYYPDFTSNQACFTLNGEDHGNKSSAYPSFQPVIPGVPGTLLRLTPNVGYQGGSAWFNTPQPVSGPFTTTFTFQLAPSGGADGIAFVIQNSGTSALGPTGCGEGFAGDFPYPPGCTPIASNSLSQSGITNSLAIRFDSYSQGVGGATQTNDPGVNNVTIQSCPGQAANSITAACQLGVYAFQNVTFGDGNVHSATVTYSPTPSSAQTSCTVNDTQMPCLDVILDGTDLFPTGVPFDMTTLGIPAGTAYVGFTGATGGLTDTQDIRSWTFTPQGQTQTIQPGTTATYTFQNNAFSFSVALPPNQPATTTTVTPIYTTGAACNALVQQKYQGAQCFVYTNLTPNPDSAIMFEITCPNLPNNQCNPFTADLGSVYTFSSVNNPNPTDPYAGWLKGEGPDPTHPCTPPQSGSLFQSNQISIFALDTTTKGHSGGTGSCWVATYDQPDETLSAITITSPINNAVYAQGASVPANYACANPTTTQVATNPVGPYLPVASCTQSSGTGGSCTQTPAGLSCTGTVDTSTPGPHTFTVTAIDTGVNQSSQSVNYTVVAPTNLQVGAFGTPGTVANGGTITYTIGVADFGPVNASGVVLTDPLPSNTSFISGSGSNVTCAFVNKKLTCTTTPITCSAAGNTVSCNVGMLAPLSISSLNGGALTIKAKVNSQPATMCGTKPCTVNTVSASAINADTNANPTVTVKTTW